MRKQRAIERARSDGWGEGYRAGDVGSLWEIADLFDGSAVVHLSYSRHASSDAQWAVVLAIPEAEHRLLARAGSASAAIKDGLKRAQQLLAIDQLPVLEDS